MQDATKLRGLHPSEFLLHLNRPVRSISSYPNPPEVSEVPFLFPQWKSLLFPSNAIQNKPEAENIYRGDHGGSHAPTFSNNPLIGLYR